MHQFIEQRFGASACQLNIAHGPANGPHLILLHGATSWWHSWDPVLPHLCEDYHIHAVDLRGSGRSDRTPGQYSVLDMTRDVADFLDSLDGPAHIAGHSFGAHVALALSAERSGKILSLTLADMPLTLTRGKLAGRPAGPGFAAWLKILARDPSPETILKAVQRVDSSLSGPRQRSRAQCLRLLDPGVLEVYVNGEPFALYDPESLFTALPVPTLMILADPQVDTRMDRGTAAHASSLSPHLVSHMIRGAGHNVHADDPDAFIEALGHFLATAV